MPGSTQHKPASQLDIEEARRLLYVGMTRAKERLVLTRAAKRGDLPTGGIQFLAEMGLKLETGGRAHPQLNPAKARDADERESSGSPRT